MSSTIMPRSADRSTAQKRWRLLARALTRSPDLLEDEPLSENEEISVRRFTSFELLHPVHLENEADCTWWLYTRLLEGELYEVLVRRVSKCFTANELMGFNNTGNVCVWPSEECLAYYLLKNPEICRRRKVLELGGGMSCLAGVLAAKYCEPSSTTLTDGNVTSVENVRCIVERNGMSELVRCAVVQWARAAKALRQSAANCNGTRLLQEFNGDGSYEVILCADCLFFDEARLDLVDTIYGWLADEGIALVMAPRRGATFRKFAEAAVQRGFTARQTERYDAEPTSTPIAPHQTGELRPQKFNGRRLQVNLEVIGIKNVLDRPTTKDILKVIDVEAEEQRPEDRPLWADYWKSQARKYCDFCKCWIADNKPSVEFHEGGKKHKENVAKRLKEIHRNSAKQAKQQKKFEDDFEKMEKAAMAAYLKDVEGDARDMSADKIIHEKWNKKEEESREAGNPNQMPYAAPEANPRFNDTDYHRQQTEADIDPFDPYAKQKLARIEARKSKANKEASKSKDKSQEKGKSEKGKGKRKRSPESSGSRPPIRKVWYEARAQGHSYYWNIDTNESVWEPPPEGFMSLAEQAEEAKEQELQEQFLSEIDQTEAKEKAEILEEQRANAEREKLKEIRKRFAQNIKTESDDGIKKEVKEEEESEEEKIPYRRDYSVPEKPQPYGSWQVVKTIETPKIDLQLPRSHAVKPAPVISFSEPPQTKVFKEKTITHISTGDSDDDGPTVSFKKGKFKNKNIRRRMSDD